MRSALVFGFGAVERLACTWHPDAKVEELEPRLWIVRVAGQPIGMIGMDPWDRAEIDMIGMDPWDRAEIARMARRVWRRSAHSA